MGCGLQLVSLRLCVRAKVQASEPVFGVSAATSGQSLVDQ